MDTMLIRLGAFLSLLLVGGIFTVPPKTCDGTERGGRAAVWCLANGGYARELAALKAQLGMERQRVSLARAENGERRTLVAKQETELADQRARLTETRRAIATLQEAQPKIEAAHNDLSANLLDFGASLLSLGVTLPPHMERRVASRPSARGVPSGKTAASTPGKTVPKVTPKPKPPGSILRKLLRFGGPLGVLMLFWDIYDLATEE